MSPTSTDVVQACAYARAADETVRAVDDEIRARGVDERASFGAWIVQSVKRMWLLYQNAACASNSDSVLLTVTLSLCHSGYFQRHMLSVTVMSRDSFALV